MAFEHWYCEVCRQRGCVRYKKHAGVYEVQHELIRQHRRFSPECADVYGMGRVRLGGNTLVPVTTGESR